MKQCKECSGGGQIYIAVNASYGMSIEYWSACYPLERVDECPECDGQGEIEDEDEDEDDGE